MSAVLAAETVPPTAVVATRYQPSHICGNPDKQNRRAPESFIAAVRQRLAARPHLLVLHEGPDGGEPTLRGNPELRAALGSQPTLVICGHVHWDRPLVTLATGPQLLNVDARVVLLERAT